MTTRPSFLTLHCLALAVLASCGPEGEEDEHLGTAVQASTSICPTTYVEGLDVSAAQGNIDWNAVKASGRQFAFIKATQGDYYTNGFWNSQWNGAKAAGVLRSPYHFFDPTVDGIAQAKYFLGVVGAFGPGDLPPMLDIECPTSSNQAATQPDCEYPAGPNYPADSGWATPAVLNQRIQDWLNYVQAQTGKVPILYSYNYWFGDSAANTAPLHKYPLDISWPTTGTCFTVGLGNDFTTAAYWQWSVTGSCPGVGGQVDLDRFLGTLDQLKQLAGYGALSQLSGNDAMTLVNWPNDGHPEIFVKDKSGEMFHTYPNGASDTWNQMYPLDTGSECGGAAGFWTVQGYAELFDPAPDGSVQHLWFDAKNGWNKWQASLAGAAPTTFSHLSTLVWPDGHMEVFALGADHAIWHTHLQQGLDPGWAAWASMDGDVATGAAPILWSDGHAEIFATDATGAAWHNWSGTGAGFPNGWHGWATLGGSLASRPVPVRWADGHVEVFATGLDGQLYHSDFTNGMWPAFSVLSAGVTIEGEPSAIMNTGSNGATLGPEIFARGSDGKVTHLGWGGMSYGTFAPLLDQTTASDPFGWIREDGTAEVFAIDDTGVLTRTYHDPKNGWTPWTAIGGTNLDPCLPAKPVMDGGMGGSGGGVTTTSGATTSSATTGVTGGGGTNAEGKKGGCSCRTAGDENDAAPGALAALAIAGVVAARRRRGAAPP
jgi:MYXO-CTERM domain-containing protein